MFQETYGLRINETHFIGHSLGAQLAGYVGTWLKERKQMNLGRISGTVGAVMFYITLYSVTICTRAKKYNLRL